MLVLDADLAELFPKENVFSHVMALEGEIFRQVEQRKTLRFTLGEKNYFAKLHFGVGWREIIKNFLQLKKPILSAYNEIRAVHRLQDLNIDTVRIAGFGCEGKNPARLRSFIITEDLGNTISLEDFCRDWALKFPPFFLKQLLLKKVANVARVIHEHGVNHRDFYICHFHLDVSFDLKNLNQDDLKLYVIDLHRAQCRKKTPQRWIIKDIAGLYFSAMDIGLTKRDLFRFMKIYKNKTLRACLKEDADFWKQVQRCAKKLYSK